MLPEAKVPERSTMKKVSGTQLDLFLTSAGPMVELTGSERQRAVALLQVLLTEAMASAVCNPTAPTAQEAGDE